MAIELDVQTPTPCVVLHAAHMNITGVTLLGMGVKDGIPGRLELPMHALTAAAHAGMRLWVG